MSEYINPFADGSWGLACSDLGVDFIPGYPSSPVYAIGDGIITTSRDSILGWPGRSYLAYQLQNGTHAGLFIYVADKLSSPLPVVGAVIEAGEHLCDAFRDFPCPKWGWASPPNGASAAPTVDDKVFARFIRDLPGHPTIHHDPGPGSDRPGRP